MSVRISIKEYKHAHLVVVAGRVDPSTCLEFDNALKKLIAEDHFKIVVDLEDVDFMSSCGLRALLSAFKEAQRFNRGDVRLCRVPDKVKKALELAGFLELFKTYTNSTDAVGSF